ncbi:MAG TPA: hypothetical protein PLJ10_13175 [Candidatus Hydrogenedens sp.]|nr:hypothetical protein [Candidatus Hydrogenedens sp.]
MLKKSLFTRTIVITFSLIVCHISGYSWQHHPLFTRAVMETMPEVANASAVQAESLENFLIAEEQGLAQVLANVEAWAQKNVTAYAPCPNNLVFTPTGSAQDIRQRFFNAIRINPNTKTPLYYVGYADQPPEGKTLLNINEVCILSNTKEFELFCFIALNEGEEVMPIDVLASASNEPDYGIDTGLFKDNQTEVGAIYGFGVQPFGNPNLDFGSQAPFHMGFFHENPIITLFAPFLKQSYTEYRIYLYKELAKFAFATGHNYWGWRFSGWGLHYIGDLSMPYHTTALPGYSALRMLWIYLLDILGWHTPKNNAVQLSSNRHLAIETFMGRLYLNAMHYHDDPFQILEGLSNAKMHNNINSGYNNKCWWRNQCVLEEGKIPEYNDSLPKDCLAWRSHNWSKTLDRLISKTLPDRFVNDPSVELNDLEERYDIVDITLSNTKFEKVRELVDTANASLSLFNYYGKSYLKTILNLP